MQKRQRALIIILIITLFSCETCKTRMTNEAVQIIQKMTISEKIGQMLMLGVPGKKISKDTASIINNYMPGGIILFGYNLGSTEEIKLYIEDMQQTIIAKNNIPLFISIDQEGGRVKRITDKVTQFPGNMAFGVVDNEALTYDAARITGIELRNIGVNMNLAPALDVNNNPLNPVINTRSFGSDVKVVSRLGAAYIKGLQRSGCIAVGKHFPGHGDTDKDSHLTLPVINYDLKRLRKIELPPFSEAIDNGVEAIMTAHISYPNILKDNLPATISKQFLTEILRGEMNFNGLIITDDMEMNAVSKVMDLGEGAVKSILAGADIILVSTHGKSIEIISQAITKAVDDGVISIKRIDKSAKRVIESKLRYSILNIDDGKVRNAKINFNKEELDILKKADELNRKVSKEAIYLYSNAQYNLEPINTSNSPKLFISSNEFFRKEIENKFSGLKNTKYLIFKTGKEFNKYFTGKKLKENKKNYLNNAFVYYQFDKTEEELVNKISETCKEFDLKLFLLCTGNPFLLRSMKELPPTLFTFSNTNESMRQMILCLNGEFKSKEKINVYLGLKNK